jgi:hypothetical protein
MRVLVVLIAIALGGCAGAEGPSSDSVRAARAVPANYKAELLAHLRTFLNDPTNVRNAYVSEPTLTRIQGADRYVTCLRFDAKNSYGGYRGNKDYIATYFGGKLEYFVELRPETKDEWCRSATYQPFPELEKLARR